MIGLCQPCKEKGKFRAPYKVVKGVPMCGGCVADLEENPPEPQKPQTLQFLEKVTKEKEESPVLAGACETKKGTTMAQICKCGCGETLRIDNRTGYKTGHKPAGGGDTSPAPKKRAAKNGASRWADTIEQLREERDRIDVVIGELEKMS